MSQYRRSNIKGGTYFFTVVTYRRRPVLCSTAIRTALRMAIRSVRRDAPFHIDAWVLLPDHLHCIWTLPLGDSDYAKRWAMIKRVVTKQCKAVLHEEALLTQAKQRRNEGTLWQRRYWEHLIRDEADYARHVDYIHWNPVKHGLVDAVSDWPYSTFHRFVRQGLCPPDWGGGAAPKLDDKSFGE